MAKSPKKITLAEVKDYKGNVVARWRVPKTKRQSAWAVVRLLRFFYRARERKFLTREMLEALKEYGRLIEEKFPLCFLVHPELIEGFRELMNYELPHDLTEEVVEEKIRRSENAICSMCGVDLVKPAYVVKRKGFEVVSISDPIGIRCLNSFYGKLKDLIVEMKLERGETQPGKTVRKSRRPQRPAQLPLF